MNDSRFDPGSLFWSTMLSLGMVYAVLIVLMLLADTAYITPAVLWRELQRPTVQYSLQLSLISSGVSTIVALWIATPTAYVLSRWRLYESQISGADRRRIQMLRLVLESILDIPIVLPPLVVGISLLVLFQTSVGQWLESVLTLVSQQLGHGPRGITFEVPAVIVAQTMVVTAFAIQMLRQSYDKISSRGEQVARTLGASRWQTFSGVIFPQLKSGLLATGTMVFAKSLGEFGPILVFAGMTPMKTEVLPTSIYLNFQKGDLSAAVALSMVMVMISLKITFCLRISDVVQMDHFKNRTGKAGCRLN